ncbi:MAG TPA: hypothetical protein VIJ88_02885 [Candidatus Paceibacterota bacterium]
MARRLAETHQVTIVTYGRLPEQVPGVTIIAVDKRRPLLPRLWSYRRALRHAARTSDVVYAQNGPSVELPLLFVSARKVFHIADVRAHAYASRHFLRGVLEWLVSRSVPLVKEMPSPKPEILPFAPRPEEALAKWDEEWKNHIDSLNTMFHAR